MYTNLVKLGPVYTILKVFRVFKLYTTILKKHISRGSIPGLCGLVTFGGLKKVLNVRIEDEYAGRRVNDMKHEFIAINL